MQKGCCGKNCLPCVNYPHDCIGCRDEGGRVFWLEYADEVICPIYNCCRNLKRLDDCGLCPNHPCGRYKDEYDTDDCGGIPALTLKDG